MNDNNVKNEFNNTLNNNAPVEPYKTQNMNSLVNTSAISTNDTLNVNIQNNNQNLNIPNFVNQNNDIMPQNVNATSINSTGNTKNDNSTILYDTTSNINNKPVAPSNKKKVKLNIDSDLKTIIGLTIVLLICISLVPVLFDFFSNLKLKIFG